MNTEPAEAITLTPRQVALVHHLIFGPEHLSCDRFSLITGYTELMIYCPHAERPSLFKKLSGCLATADALFKWLADQAETARLAVQAGTFNPQHDGEIPKGSFYGLRRPTSPVSLKLKQLEGYFQRFGDWARAGTAFVNATSIRMEQSANDSNLNEIRDEIQRESEALWEKQKSLIAEFNTMCGIERRELEQPCKVS
jgi:hypothetical protein